MEKVAIIISTYRRDVEILDKAIKSAVNQKYVNYEIVVVDDNTDVLLSKEIEECTKKYSGKVRYLTYEGNKGACYARNYGADATTGEYLAFLDDDDVWYSDKLRKQLEFLKYNDCVLVGCNSTHIVVDKDWKEKSRSLDVRTTNSVVDMEELLYKNVVGGCSFPLMLRSAFEKAGKFRIGLPASQDYDLWIRIAKFGKIGHVGEQLLDYYIHQCGNITKNVDSKIQSYTLFIDQYANLAKDKKAFVSNKYLTLSWVCYIGANYAYGRKYLQLGLKTQKSFDNYKKAFQALKAGLISRARLKN